MVDGIRIARLNTEIAQGREMGSNLISVLIPSLGQVAAIVVTVGGGVVTIPVIIVVLLLKAEREAWYGEARGEVDPITCQIGKGYPIPSTPCYSFRICLEGGAQKLR
jgi:hypothetical protein